MQQAMTERAPQVACILPAAVANHPLLRRWSGEALKLYLWLRANVARGAEQLPPEGRQWHHQGYLVAAATSDVLREQALPVSRNTLGKVVRELAAAGACHVHGHRRGYVFLLGEWEERPSRSTAHPVYLEGFYTDRLLADPSTGLRTSASTGSGRGRGEPSQ